MFSHGDSNQRLGWFSCRSSSPSGPGSASASRRLAMICSGACRFHFIESLSAHHGRRPALGCLRVRQACQADGRSPRKSVTRFRIISSSDPIRTPSEDDPGPVLGDVPESGVIITSLTPRPVGRRIRSLVGNAFEQGGPRANSTAAVPTITGTTRRFLAPLLRWPSASSSLASGPR